MPDIETLFDNFPSGQDSGTALPAITDNDAPNWTPNGHTNVPLGKALTSADDDKFLVVDWSSQYTFGSDNHQVRRATVGYPGRPYTRVCHKHRNNW